MVVGIGPLLGGGCELVFPFVSTTAAPDAPPVEQADGPLDAVGKTEQDQRPGNDVPLPVKADQGPCPQTTASCKTASGFALGVMANLKPLTELLYVNVDCDSAQGCTYCPGGQPLYDAKVAIRDQAGAMLGFGSVEPGAKLTLCPGPFFGSIPFASKVTIPSAGCPFKLEFAGKKGSSGGVILSESCVPK